MSTIFHLFDHSKYSAQISAGEIVYKAKSPAQEVYFLVHGEIEIQLESKVVETLTDGSMFGELALLDEGVHGADAVAKTDCTLVTVPAKQFHFMVEQTPYFALRVMKLMAERMHHQMKVLGE